MTTPSPVRARLLLWTMVLMTALMATASRAADAPPGPPGQTPAGVAAVDITPDYPVRLNGFGFRRAESEGVNQKLYAKALAIGADADQPFILFTIDNLGIPDAIAEEVAARLKKKAGIERARIAFTATHTHTAPMLKGLAPTLFGAAIPPEHQANIDKYTAQFTDWLEEAAVKALKDRRPTTLHWAIGTVRFAANRRTKNGPVDHDLPVLVAKSEGRVRAVFANYACHCVTLSHNKLGGDWAGYAQAAMQEQFPGAIALVGIGCGADANPSSGVTGDKTDIAAAQGKQIADEVARLLKTPMNALTAKPAATFSRIDLPLDKPRTKEEWDTRAKQPGAVGYHAKVNLERLDRGEKLPEKISYPVQTWAFGDQLAMVFLPGEVVVDYAVRLKRELDGHCFWINAYANAAPCYIPSERILKEGGYEGGDAMIYYDLPQRIAPGVEKLVIDEVHRQTPDTFNAKSPSRGTGDSKPMTPQQSLAAIEVFHDYTVELVASEPLIQSPVAIDFGPDGRLWVVEMRDYPMGMDGNYKPGGCIKVLEDTDGDGKYDKPTVFLDGLPFPTGVMAWRKGVLICAAPDVIYAEDTDGDGKADVKRTILAGFATHNYQARVNSLRFGLDNWVYAAAGLFGGKIRSFSGKEIDLTNRDFRFKPDTGEIEAVAGQSQQGRARSDWGDWFGCDSGTLVKHYPFEDRYLKLNPNIAPPPMTVPVRETFFPNEVFPISNRMQLFKLSGAAGRVTAACGIEIIRDAALWNISLLGDRTFAFVCEPVNLLVHRLPMSRSSSSFFGAREKYGEDFQAEFLASTDTWFRPVEARTGPDGALWIVDMYRFVIEHPRWIPPERVAEIDVRAGSEMGRIYRVFPAASGPRKPPRLDKLDTAGLVAALDNPTGTVRDRAQQMLVWTNDKAAVELLVATFKNSKSALARLHALYTLEAMGSLDDELIIEGMASGVLELQRQSLRLAESRITRSPAMITTAVELVGSLRGSRQAPVAVELAMRLGETDDPAATKALADILTKRDIGEDEHVIAAVFLASGKRVDAMLERTLARQANDQPLQSSVAKLVQLAVTQRDDAAIARVVTHIAGLGEAGFDNAAVLLEALADRKWTFSNWRAAAAQPIRDAIMADALDRLFKRAAEIVGDAEASPVRRARALLLLPRQEGAADKHLALMRRLLGDHSTPQLQSTALFAIAELRDDRGAAVIGDAWPSFSPALRRAAVEVLLTRESFMMELLKIMERNREVIQQLQPAQRQRLLTSGSKAVREQAAKVLGRPADESEKKALIEKYAVVATMKGDAGRGREVFTKACSTCHQLQGVGKPIAPDLAALTDRTASALLTAIIDPSRDLMPQYVGYRITTTDDDELTGMIAEESSTAIVLATLDGNKQTLLRNRIKAMSSTGLSLMPQGLEQAIDVAAMADLFAFINLTPPKPKVFEENKPQRVKAERDSSLTLPATAAEIYGKEIAYEPPNKNIGMWHGKDDHVIWSAEIGAAGTYDVALEWACAEGSAGSAFVIEIDGQFVRGTVVSTGGWDKFTTKIVGRVKLSAGEIRVAVKPDGPLKTAALMDLRSVTLTPVKAP